MMVAEEKQLRFGLPAECIQAMQAVFSRHRTVEKVILFGSRAIGNYKDGSDIDLAVLGKPLAHGDLLSLRVELSELSYAYTYDVLDYQKIINPDLVAHIDDLGIEFFEREPDALNPGWKNYTLDELGEILNSKRVPLNSRERATKKGKYPYYGASGIVDFLDAFIFEGEYVLISEDGENLRSRQTPIAFKVDGKFWVNNHAHIFKGKTDWVNDFVIYFFKNSDINPFLTGAVQPKLNKENLLSIPITLPSEEEAKAIVGILRSLDDKIELNLRLNQTLETLAQTLFRQFTDTTEKTTLDEYVELNPKLSIRKDSKVKYVEMKDVPELGFSIQNFIFRPFSSGSKFQQFDTLLARITPCLENGKTGFVDFLEGKEIAFGSTEFIVMRAKSTVSPYFVYQLSRTPDFREFAIKSMVGTSGRQRVQTDVLNSFELGKISAESMNEFHQTVKPFFEKIRANTQENQTLTALRDSLLPKLMSGQITVPA